MNEKKKHAGERPLKTQTHKLTYVLASMNPSPRANDRATIFNPSSILGITAAYFDFCQEMK
jgi:hypothetical protein